ncbi:DUF4142 domain-containing protein [Paracraurococcus ruber]|uniref:DUF4142 domain-containing protein n=1 Tax=Paracraurococcus ruber TaxID=77675 RepID=A0ABS1CX28_9PROT|nr:DUF4142 domain-containing protein [Paracraurococcus ruber]MBK1658880.1 hypothetical protein [Paracraurococcus ruber]TDG32246.1 DUF4142 domain-containing protein [Paracraurococcus ruber]
MRRIALGAALALGLAGCAATQQAADTTVAAAKAQVNPTLSTQDATFMTEATRDGLAEVAMARLAEKYGRSPAVKRFARHMIEDHGRANQEMLALARRKDITPPETMGVAHQQTHDRLANLRGAAFDRAYVRTMLEDHQDDVREFQAQVRDGTDPEVKAFAERYLPVLQEHAQQAQRLARR